MSTLTQLQDQFQQYLFTGKDTFTSSVISTEEVSAEVRLDIYRFAYRARLTDALASNFPILFAYLGDETFRELASDYIMAYPSQYRSVRWYGDSLPEFLQAHDYFNQYPFLSELAQFEWLQTLVFDGADAPCLQIHEMTQVQPEQWAVIRFRAHPTVHRINLAWNVDEIWQAVTDENEQLPEAVCLAAPLPWICWRRDLVNRFYAISEQEAWAIDAVLQSKTFGEICEGLCQWINEDEAGQYAASLLKGWIESGILSQVVLDSSSNKEML